MPAVSRENFAEYAAKQRREGYCSEVA